MVASVMVLPSFEVLSEDVAYDLTSMEEMLREVCTWCNCRTTAKRETGCGFERKSRSLRQRILVLKCIN
jgi:hypothetical protein